MVAKFFRKSLLGKQSPQRNFFNSKVFQGQFLRNLIYTATTLVLLGCTSLMACQPNLSFEDPPHIYYGEDVCDQCSMIINEERFASSYVTKDGTIRRFDDIGGMVIYDQEHSEEVVAYWVHDFETEEWIDAKKAIYVISKETTTPMAYGIIAFNSAHDASRRASEFKGTVVNFVELFSSEILSGFDDHDDHDD